MVEELGRACAPGPYLPTALAAAVLQAAGGAAAEALLPRIASGELTGAVALGRRDARSLGGTLADVIVVRRSAARGYALDAAAVGATEVQERRPRRGASARIDARRCAAVRRDRRLADSTGERVRELAAVLFAAEAVGVAQWCVDTAAEYAKVRVQFGRPIGQFQGVKHRCADMLARTELAARGGVGRRARGRRRLDNGAALAIAAAAALAFDAAFLNGKDCVQTLGGIGFTWEHDAHIYLRRAMTLHQLVGTPDDVAHRRRARGDARRRAARLAVDLGPRRRRRIRAELRALPRPRSRTSPPAEQRHRLADDGYITPGVAAAVGPRRDGARAARDRGGVPRREGARGPNIGVGAWALPTLIVLRHARAAGALDPADAARRDQLVPAVQRARRRLRPRRRCRRSATRVEGGWVLNGQKVWTSMAKEADWGICLARTDPDAAEARRHLVLHGRHEDARHRHPAAARAHRAGDVQRGVLRRRVRARRLPRRPGARRLALPRARRSPTSASTWVGSNTIGGGVVGVLRGDRGARASPTTGSRSPRSATSSVTGHALAVLGFRMTLAALAGADPSGSEAAVRKLLGVQHDQHVQEVGMSLMGADAAADRRRRGRVGRRRSCSTAA